MGLFRRKTVAVVTTRVCPACGLAGLVQLAPGQLCPTCTTQRAWDEAGKDGGLVVDDDAIAEAVRRRQGEAAGERIWRKLMAWALPILSLACAASAAWLFYALLAPRSIGPLAALLDDLQSSQSHALWVGIGVTIVGLVGVVRLRRNRHHRRLAYVASHSLAVLIGATCAIAGGLHTLATNSRFGGAHTSMPARGSSFTRAIQAWIFG